VLLTLDDHEVANMTPTELERNLCLAVNHSVVTSSILQWNLQRDEKAAAANIR
jgi:hypothetical protein